MHVHVQQDAVVSESESVGTEQEYRNALWARFMANVDAVDDAANDALVQAHGQFVRARAARTA